MDTQSQFNLFATINNSHIILQQKALNRLSQFDFLSIVTFQGNFHGMPTLINSQNGQQIDNNQNAIWISKYPYFSTTLKRYITMLKLTATNQNSLSIAHTFCSLLSNITLVLSDQNINLRYLIQPLNLIKNQSDQFQSKLSGLIGLIQNSNENFIGENLQLFLKILQSQGLQQTQIFTLYPVINGYQFGQDKTVNNISTILPYIQHLIQQDIGNINIIMYGQTITQYAKHLVQSFESSGLFDIKQAQNNISVDQNFDRYLDIVTKYNNKCKATLGNQTHENIQQLLKGIRSQIQQQQLFEQNDYYLKKLQIYINRKQNQLINLNQQLNNTNNINLLQQQSRISLNKIRENKKKIKQQDLVNQINNIIYKYQQNSHGNNSQKLLKQFLQIFIPTLYSEAGIESQMDKKINKAVRENSKLQSDLQLMQNKKKGCCQIM